MLTGLSNRILFESRLEMALAKVKRQGENLAVLFLDLNKFKQVNDNLGHAAGDTLLKEVGMRLKYSLRVYDTAARFGGDEFAVLLEGLRNVRHAEIVAKKIIQIMNRPFLIAGQKVTIGVSIGIATYTAGQSVSYELLMQQADEAMYSAKSSPESTYRFYGNGADQIQAKNARG